MNTPFLSKQNMYNIFRNLFHTPLSKSKRFSFHNVVVMISKEGEDDGNISKWVCKFLEGLFVFGMRPTGQTVYSTCLSVLGIFSN